MATTKKAAAKKKAKPAAATSAKKTSSKGGKGAAKSGTTSKAPLTSTALAALLDVKITKRLDTTAVRKLRKALPGYSNMLDDVAALLEEDAALLNLRDVRPADLLAAQARLKELSAKEGVVEAVYRSVYEQRLQADDQAMGMLLKIVRRIETASEDDPDVRMRWKSVLDFLSKFRRGPSAPAPVEDEAADK